jgi:hypothetical protein
MPPEVFKNGRWQSTESLIRGALHQAEGIVWIKTRPTALLGDDMGMGKTMQSLAAVDPFSPLLIITTASTQRNWQAEAEMWRPDLKPICVKKKDFRWPGIHEAIITCWSSLPMYDPPEGVEKHSEEMILHIMKMLEANYGTVPYNMTVIYDECQYGKNKKALRSKAATALGRMARSNGGKTWGLSGTPLPNKPPDLYGVLKLLDLSDAIWPTWRDFVKSFNGKKRKESSAYEWGKPTKQVREYLGQIMIRRLADDYLQIPPVTFHEIEIPRAHLQTDILEQCDSLLNWAGGPDALEGRLGMLREEDKRYITSVRSAIATALIPSVMAIAQKFIENGLPVAVFSYFTPVVEILGQQPGWVTVKGDDSKDERYDSVLAFQGGFKEERPGKVSPVNGIAFTTAGCEGITLTRAKVLIRASLDWTPGRNEQAVRRLSRLGQDSPVDVIDILVEHPIERILHAALQKKELTLRAAGLHLRSEVKLDIKPERIVVGTDAPAPLRPETLALRPLDQAEQNPVAETTVDNETPVQAEPPPTEEPREEISHEPREPESDQPPSGDAGVS